MINKLTYKIVKAVGEETVKGNVAFDQLEQLVNEHIDEGWQPVGEVAVSSVAGPKTAGTRVTGIYASRKLWFARVSSDGMRPDLNA